MSVMSASSVASDTKPIKAAVTSQAQAEWMRLFPLQGSQTYTSSVAFMRQLTTIAISTITYSKELFPQECYRTETFGGVALRILKAECEDKCAQFISRALINSFEALEKKYLDKLVLCLYCGSCQEQSLVEAHAFEYSYSAAGVSVDLRSAGRGAGSGAVGSRRVDTANTPATRHAFETIRKRTLDLLKTIVVSHPRVKTESYDVSLRLYYNEQAPLEYQAPGYSALPAEEAARAPDRVARALADAAELGAVDTQFHSLVARSYLREEPNSYEANASPNSPKITQYESDDWDSEKSVPRLPDAERALRCVCAREPYTEHSPLLTCDYCGTVQHALCYGVSGARARHCCARCADLDPARAATCPDFRGRASKARKSLCLFRHVVWWAARAGRVSGAALADRFHLARALAGKLLQNLLQQGILTGDYDGFYSPLVVNQEQLNKALDTYFSPNTNASLDPVGATLAPEERTTLQNATNMGKIIQHTPPEQKDSTLNQYKQALFDTDKDTNDELPLSGSHNPVKNIGNIEAKSNIKRKMDSTLNQHKQALFDTDNDTNDELPLSGSHNPVKNIGNIEAKSTIKRKMDSPVKRKRMSLIKPRRDN